MVKLAPEPRSPESLGLLSEPVTEASPDGNLLFILVCEPEQTGEGEIGSVLMMSLELTQDHLGPFPSLISVYVTYR